MATEITLGELLVGELGRRGLRGAYFNYAGYKALRLVTNAEEMQAFLDTHGFSTVLATDDPAWIADGMAEAVADESGPWWGQDILFLFALPFIVRSWLRRKPRMFPRRPRAVKTESGAGPRPLPGA